MSISRIMVYTDNRGSKLVPQADKMRKFLDKIGWLLNEPSKLNDSQNVKGY